PCGDATIEPSPVCTLHPKRSSDWLQAYGHSNPATSYCHQEIYTQTSGTRGGSSTLPSSTKPQIQTAPQPVPASYATASTPSQPTFNVQVRSAQPGPQHQAPIGQHFGQQPIRSPAQVQYMPAQPKGPDFAYGPPQPGFSQMAQGAYQDQHHPGVHQVGGLSSRRAEPAPAQDPRKTYITDVPPSLAPYTAGPAVSTKVQRAVVSVRGIYVHAWKEDQVWTPAVFTSYVGHSPQVTDPSCPAPRSYEQLFKKPPTGCRVTALPREPEGVLGQGHRDQRVCSGRVTRDQRVCSGQGHQRPEGVLGAGSPETRGCARGRVTRDPEGVLGAGSPETRGCARGRSPETRGCTRGRVTRDPEGVLGQGHQRPEGVLGAGSPETRGCARGRVTTWNYKGSAHTAHPEDELERLTKKMLFDMDHPPSEEYFGAYQAVWEAFLKVSVCAPRPGLNSVLRHTCSCCSYKAAWLKA
ncbi:hypothetical protein KUCAC02_022434, partial [Chaenocephalus aceratus]